MRAALSSKLKPVKLNNLPSGFSLSDHANSVDFTLSLCKGRLGNVYSFKTHVLSYCSVH